MTEFLLVGRQAWQKTETDVGEADPLHWSLGMTWPWSWSWGHGDAEETAQPSSPDTFFGGTDFFGPRGAQWLWWMWAWKRWLSDGCISLHYIWTVTVDVRWSLSVLAFFEDIKNPFARFYGAFGYGGELKLCKMWMCVVFLFFLPLFLILQDFHGFLKQHPGTVSCGGHHWPMREISGNFNWILSGPQWSLEPPVVIYIIFGDKFRMKKPSCCEHPLGGGFKFQIFLYFSIIWGRFPFMTNMFQRGAKPPTSPFPSHGTRPYGPVDEGVDVKVLLPGEGVKLGTEVVPFDASEIPKRKNRVSQINTYMYIIVYIYKEVLNEAKWTTELSWWAG